MPELIVFQLHTFLFADLVGFSEFTAQQGDDRGADLAVSFHQQVCALAAELDCHVVKAIGDAVMVRSEDGNTAIELAIAILGLAERKGFPLARVGLDTGPAVERNGDWFGSTVNTASRVASAATAGAADDRANPPRRRRDDLHRAFRAGPAQLERPARARALWRWAENPATT